MSRRGICCFGSSRQPTRRPSTSSSANLAKAQATETNAKLQLERGNELVRNRNIPQSTLDQRAADEAAAQASVLEAQALLEQAEVNLGYTEIRSPIDGRIGLATFTVGNLVQPSSGRLATIVSQDPVYIIFQASQRDVLEYKRRVAEFKDGHVTIHIRLPNGSVYPHPGLTNFLDVQVDPNTDTVAVRAQVPNPDRLLIPGGVVGISTERGAPRMALVIPQAAVQLDQAGRYALVVDAAKKVEPAPHNHQRRARPRHCCDCGPRGGRAGHRRRGAGRCGRVKSLLRAARPETEIRAYTDEIDAAALHLSPQGRGRNWRALRAHSG